METEHRSLPLPPLELRLGIGPLDPAHYDNPEGKLVLPFVPEPEAYRSVFDFGCGCGRVARQLIQQQPRPERYVGIDIQTRMVDWCVENLTPHAPNFRFLHHDVANTLNRSDTPSVAPFPAEDGAFSLVIAWSVFTHLLEAQANHYLRESARILAPDGVAWTTWFLFEKADFPILGEHQNALYIDPDFLESAVFFDRSWLPRAAAEVGLKVVKAMAPPRRGFQWVILLRKISSDVPEVEIPPDEAPRGTLDELMDRPSRFLSQE